MLRRAVSAGLILIAAGLASPSPAQNPPAAAAREADDRAVRQTVAEFGKQLRAVSVLAPAAQVAASMDQSYATFVVPELLASWKRAPLKAPGKRTSSPSPERIDIDTATPKGPDGYSVAGKVILLTAQERKKGGIFQANPVRMTLVRRQGRWLISAYEEKEAPL